LSRTRRDGIEWFRHRLSITLASYSLDTLSASRINVTCQLYSGAPYHLLAV